MPQISLKTESELSTQLVSDGDLMASFCSTGNEKLFEKVYENHFIPLSKYMAWISGDTEFGKDIAQSIFLKIFQNPNTFDPTRNFKVWLYSIAKNYWKNELRHQKVQQKHIETLRLVVDEEEEEPIELKKKKEALQKAIESLSLAHKEVFVLKYSNNLSITEISEVCNCSRGTVKSRLFYSMKHIKESIQFKKH